MIRFRRLLFGFAGTVLAVAAAFYLFLAYEVPDIRPLREPVGISPFVSPRLDWECTFAQWAYRPVEFAELPPHVVNAFVASLDQTFFTETRWKRYRENCGATVRQVLVRRLLQERPERVQRSYPHKNVLSLHINLLLSREQEFTAWLNSLYFGNHACGIEAAGLIYFGRPAAELSLAEAALLATLPIGPADYNPATEPEAARKRRDWVLSKMLKLGFITQEEALFASLMPVYPPISSAYIQARSPK